MLTNPTIRCLTYYICVGGVCAEHFFDADRKGIVVYHFPNTNYKTLQLKFYLSGHPVEAQ